MEHRAHYVGCLFWKTAALASAVVAAETVASAAASPPSPSAKDSVGAAVPHTANPLKLLFSGPQDIADPWGKLHCGVTPVQRIRECEPVSSPRSYSRCRQRTCF